MHCVLFLKLCLDGRHHSGMSSTHSTSSQSSGDSHHNMPYLGQDMEQRSSSGGSTSNQKVPYMDSRSMGGSSSEMNRHRGMPSSSDPNKRGLPHGTFVATNGSSGDSLSSLSSCKYPCLLCFMHSMNFITCDMSYHSHFIGHRNW